LEKGRESYKHRERQRERERKANGMKMYFHSIEKNRGKYYSITEEIKEREDPYIILTLKKSQIF
jgi:hypothetical protein